MIDTIQHCSMIYILLIIECFLIGSFSYPQLLLSNFIGLLSILFLRFTFLIKFKFKSFFVIYFAFYWIITMVISYELHVIKPFTICFNVSMISILLHSYFFHISKDINNDIHLKNEPVEFPTMKRNINKKYINVLTTDEYQRSL